MRPPPNALMGSTGGYRMGIPLFLFVECRYSLKKFND